MSHVSMSTLSAEGLGSPIACYLNNCCVLNLFVLIITLFFLWCDFRFPVWFSVGLQFQSAQSYFLTLNRWFDCDCFRWVRTSSHHLFRALLHHRRHQHLRLPAAAWTTCLSSPQAWPSPPGDTYPRKQWVHTKFSLRRVIVEHVSAVPAGFSHYGLNRDQRCIEMCVFCQVWLPAVKAKGLEISGTFSRRQGHMYMDMTFTNKALQHMTDFAVQFNKNRSVIKEQDLLISWWWNLTGGICLFLSFGMIPTSPLPIHTPLMPNQSIEVSLPLNTIGPVMKMDPLNNLQVPKYLFHGFSRFFCSNFWACSLTTKRSLRFCVSIKVFVFKDASCLAKWMFLFEQYLNLCFPIPLLTYRWLSRTVLTSSTSASSSRSIFSLLKMEKWVWSLGIEPWKGTDCSLFAQFLLFQSVRCSWLPGKTFPMRMSCSTRSKIAT